MTTGRSWRQAFLWMVACSLLFSLVYNLCNWITTQRADVGVWAFPWEFQIPFVAWTIIPYWTLDLLFVGSFFLCADRRELHVLGKRVALAIVLAGACFLLLPLRILFPQPEVQGVSGWLFALLRSFDQPHNLFPSLHITFCALFAEHYARHSPKWSRLAIHGWFGLIAVSTLLTYQHHVIDILGGYLLAVVCFHAFRASWTQASPARNAAVGLRYALAATLLLGIGWFSRPWGMLLLWPATGLGWVAAGYFGRGASIYRKDGGKLPLSTRILMAPVLAGHWLSFWYYCRQCEPWNEVAPGVFVGRRLSDQEALRAIQAGVTAVLDLTAESSEALPFLKLPYKNIPVLDLTAPSQDQLREGVAFIQHQQSPGKVYIHCKIGYSRSAALAAAHILACKQGTTVDEAMEQLRKIRPSIVIRPEIRAALLDFQTE